MQSHRSPALLLLSLLVAATLVGGCRSRRDRVGSDGGAPPPPPADAGPPPPPGDAGPVGDDGGPPPPTDAGPGCAGDLTLCGGACVDTWSSDAHCGSCDNACGAGARCVDAECEVECVPRCALGGGACGDDGCGGSCGTCGTGQTCVEGLCASACPPGSMDCGGVCIDPRSSTAHCGACFRACATGQTCSAGVCSTPPSGTGETCATAAALTSSATITFTGARADHTPFTCGATAARVDKAFRWTAPRSGMAVFTAIGATVEVDTMIAVFSSSTCTSTYALGCNDDDASGGLDSRLELTVVAGTTYYLVVSHYGATTPTDGVRVAAAML